MRVVCVVVSLIFLIFSSCLSSSANPLIVKSKRLTVMGMLTEDRPVGADATGWAIQLNPVIMVDGKIISSVEIKSSDLHRLMSLEDKFVQAKGKLTFIPGAETTQRLIFQLSSIKEHKSKDPNPAHK
jgi:hypothetical protein